MASSYGTDAGKTALRQEYLIARELIGAHDKERADAAIRARLEQMPLYRGAALVLSYISQGQDVDTREIIARAFAAGKRVAVPRESGSGAYEFVELHDLAQLEDGPAFGSRALTAPELIGSICLVQGLVFDSLGYRVCSSSEAMDAFLAFYPGDKIGLARQMQLSSNPLPHEAGDIAVDVLVSENVVWWCR